MRIKPAWLCIFSSIFFISSGQAGSLPNMAALQQSLGMIYQENLAPQGGKNADYIPELAKVNTNNFAIAIVTVDDKVLSVGDANAPFAIESISKPFIYGLALMDQGEKVVTAKVGLDATGKPFNSVTALEDAPHHIENPLVNAGAIQITSLIHGNNPQAKWQHALHFLQQFSDGKLFLGQAVYQSETNTNQHNRAIAELLLAYGLINTDPADAVDRYTKACSVMVTAKQLALMGATLANDGINPLTHQRILPAAYVRDILSEMVVNGLYENSGAWWWSVGLPAKSGVGGGILAVVPGKMAIVVYSPPLDEDGNSVKAQKVILDLSQQWHLHLLNP